MTAVVPLADVKVGLCQWLHDTGHGTYRPATAYQSGERAITEQSLPPNPDWAVAVAPYGVDDATVLPTQLVRVQLRFRAPADQPKSAVDQWADAVASDLHFKHNFDAGALHVSRAERVLVAPLGADDSGRQERADSYQLILTRP